MNITLADDDIRIKYPAYGLTMRNVSTIGKLRFCIIQDKYFINGQWVGKDRVLFLGEFSEFSITLDAIRVKPKP